MRNAFTVEKLPVQLGFVLMEVWAEEATEQFPKGIYAVSQPSPKSRQALFESQYC